MPKSNLTIRRPMDPFLMLQALKTLSENWDEASALIVIEGCRNLPAQPTKFTFSINLSIGGPDKKESVVGLTEVGTVTASHHESTDQPRGTTTLTNPAGKLVVGNFQIFKQSAPGNKVEVIYFFAFLPARMLHVDDAGNMTVQEPVVYRLVYCLKNSLPTRFSKIEHESTRDHLPSEILAGLIKLVSLGRRQYHKHKIIHRETVLFQNEQNLA